MDSLLKSLLALDPLILGVGGLGIALVLGVLVVNIVQLRRAGRASASASSSATEAPAAEAFDLREARRDPTMGQSAPVSSYQHHEVVDTRDWDVPEQPVAPHQAASAPTVARIEALQPIESAPRVSTPVADQSPIDISLDAVDQKAADLAAVPLGPREPTAPIDGRVHSIVKLRFGTALDAERTKLMIEDIGARFPKGHAWVWAASAAAWTGIKHITTSSIPSADAIAFSMPLATRSGAVTESALRDWMAAIAESGVTYGAEVVFAPIHEDAKRAVELDQFCGNLDLLAGVCLMRADRSAIPGTRLRGTLEAEGFHLTERGEFAMMADDGAHVLYEVRSIHGQAMSAESLRHDGVHGVTLSLDVMRVPNPVQQFDLMRGLIKRLATRLEATVVDDRGHALTDALFTQIRGELEKRVTAARTAGIEPGSPLARTLFAE